MSQSASPSVSSRRTLVRLLGRFRHALGATVVVALLLAARTAFDVSGPQLMADAIAILERAVRDGVEPDSELPEAFVTTLLLLGGVFLGRVVMLYLSTVAAAKLAQDLENHFRSELFARVLRLRFTYHDKNRSGATIARSLRDMEKARHFFGQVAFGYAEVGAIALGVIVMSFWTHWTYGVLLTVATVLGFHAVTRVGGEVARMDRVVSDDYDHVTTALQENVAGARVVRAFGRERQENSKFDGRLSRFTDGWRGLQRYWTARMPWVHTIYAGSLPLSLVLSLFLVARGEVGLDAAAAMVFYVRMIHHRLRPLTRVVILGQEAAASATRVFEVIDNTDVIEELPEPARLPVADGREPVGGVELDHVSFGHPGGVRVLHDVCLRVPAGGSLGLIGATGAGKTSLVQLLPRFYDADSGVVRLDGIDVRELDLVELRAAVGLVFQEPFLFSATIAQNLAYGRPEATREELEQCLRQAAADFVFDLPDGLETVVGERGVSLSGGQRQRLTIARALAMNPRVLVFDDATAAVDAHTERRLFEGIRAAARDRTTLVISQRVSSVKWCDRIAVLEGGRITAVGTHHELVETSDLYREIHEHQQLLGVTA